MINDPLLAVGLLAGLAAALIWLETHTGWKFFNWVPAMVCMYVACAALNTVGVFGHEKTLTDPLNAIKNALLPAMIFVFLLRCDLRKIIKLGPKLLLTFFVTGLSIVIGMAVGYAALRHFLHPEAWKVLGALIASWTGGSANMVAVQDVLQAPKNIFGYALMTDTVLYSIWLVLMIASVPFAGRFDAWTKANTAHLQQHASTEDPTARPMDGSHLAFLLGGSLFLSALAWQFGAAMPVIKPLVNATTWAIIFVTVLGLIAALTPLGRTPGSPKVANVLLFIVIGIIASGSDFSGIVAAPLYLAVGAICLAVHAAIMVIYAKLTKTELFSIVVSSTAQVGGVASAPIVAAAFSAELVPVGILFALMGAVEGTFVGLISAQLLSMIP